jgi:hypothetical protein
LARAQHQRIEAEDVRGWRAGLRVDTADLYGFERRLRTIKATGQVLEAAEFVHAAS